jgi:hypothetical protein
VPEFCNLLGKIAEWQKSVMAAKSESNLFKHGGRSVKRRTLVALVLSSLVVMAQGLGAASPCVTPPAGLVSWWRAEGDGTDFVGNNDGVLQGGVTFAVGEVGQAFSFNGVDGNVQVPASATLDVGRGAGLTIEAWINPADVANGHSMVEWSGGVLTSGYSAHFWVGHPQFGAGSIFANLVDTSANFHVINSGAGVVTTNVFQHVAVTYDKASGLARLFVNGIIVQETNLGTFLTQTSYDLYLGCRPASSLYTGLMDEVSLYNRALGTNEIQALYAAGVSGKCTTPTPPFITTQPANQTVVMGGTATFTVGAEGKRSLSYQWSFNGTNLLVGATNSWLTLTHVQLSQAGNYTV